MTRFGETLGLAVFVTVILGTLGWVLLERRLEARLAALARARPPVAVIDYAPVNRALARGAALDEIQALFAAIEAEGRTLAARGFLVVTSAQIVAAPPGTRVAPAPVASGGAGVPAIVPADPAALPAPPGLGFGDLVEGLRRSAEDRQ